MAELIATKKDPYPGCVKRVLNFRDRLIILNAVAEDLKGKGDIKSLARVQKLTELLDGEGVDIYFESMDDDFRQRVEKWVAAAKAREANPDEKHPGKRPRRTPAEQRGKEATFHIPSKLDAFIIETLKKAQIATAHAEFAVELAAKFGVPIED